MTPIKRFPTQHYKVQPHPSIRLRALCRRALSGPGNGQHERPPVRSSQSPSTLSLFRLPTQLSDLQTFRLAFNFDQQRVFADPSPLVSRRLGFATLPLACLVIRVVMQAIGMATRGKQDDVLFSVAEGQEVLSFWQSEGVKWAGIAVGTLICWVWCVSPLFSSLQPSRWIPTKACVCRFRTVWSRSRSSWASTSSTLPRGGMRQWTTACARTRTSTGSLAPLWAKRRARGSVPSFSFVLPTYGAEVRFADGSVFSLRCG